MTWASIIVAVAQATLLSASEVSSPPPPPPTTPSIPQLVTTPSDYVGHCEVKPKSGSLYTIDFTAKGSGKDRKLTLSSTSATFPSGEAKILRTRLFGSSRFVENFVIDQGSTKWVGSIEWYSIKSGGWLDMHEPIVVNVPINYLLITPCDLQIGKPQ